ncbi:hypothetical protein B9Z65_154 [Elsinoe australis]|uniref:Uncharacterized protein n=1 Tax=Elsinoe australis TaxID=40998 RepID=A0A2P7Z7H6_9PEZI|nr:hypothetical protein B9Z65_154 [Elsinoe australis]
MSLPTLRSLSQTYVSRTARELVTNYRLSYSGTEPNEKRHRPFYVVRTADHMQRTLTSIDEDTALEIEDPFLEDWRAELARVDYYRSNGKFPVLVASYLVDLWNSNKPGYLPYISISALHYYMADTLAETLSEQMRTAVQMGVGFNSQSDCNTEQLANASVGYLGDENESEIHDSDVSVSDMSIPDPDHVDLVQDDRVHTFQIIRAHRSTESLPDVIEYGENVASFEIRRNST